MEVFSTYSMKLTHVNEIGWDTERGKFGDIVAAFIPCNDIDQALQIARGWTGLALSFTVEAIGRNVMLNLWSDEQGRTSACLFLDREIVWFESDDHEPGMWLVEFLLAMTAALKADCCGFGRDEEYEFKYEALDCAMVLSRLADGSLLRIPTAVHLISTRLISSTEVRAAIARHETEPGFEYRESVAGYHMIYNIR